MVGAETYGSCPASRSRYFTYIVSRSSAESPARISTFAMRSIVDAEQTACCRPRLLDGDGLGEVPRLIDVQPAETGDPICEELQREDREHDLKERGRLGH